MGFLIERLFSDLSENVTELLGLRMGAPAGFMDRSMRPGTLWTEELLHAVGTCQILVALLSPRYLTSEWCGMEWHAFAQRTVDRSGASASGRQGCIIPVVWIPLSGEQLPRQVSAEMQFSPKNRPDPQAVTEYQDGGVFGLMRTQQEACYQIVVWQLSQEINHIYRSQRLKHRKFKREDLSNVFQGEML